MASSFPSTAKRGERRASVSLGLGDPSRSYRSPVAAYRDTCLRLSSREEEPRARGFACPAPPLLLAIASLPNPAIGHICLGLLPRKSLCYQSLYVWEARSARIRGKISCNLVKNCVLVFARVLCSLFLLVVFRFCWGLRWGNPRRVSYEICGRIMVKNAWFSRIFLELLVVCFFFRLGCPEEKQAGLMSCSYAPFPWDLFFPEFSYCGCRDWWWWWWVPVWTSGVFHIRLFRSDPMTPSFGLKSVNCCNGVCALVYVFGSSLDGARREESVGQDGCQWRCTSGVRVSAVARYAYIFSLSLSLPPVPRLPLLPLSFSFMKSTILVSA